MELRERTRWLWWGGRLLWRKPRLLPAGLRNLVAAARGRPRLRGIDVELTYACPLRCEQCYTDRYQAPARTWWQPDRLLALVREARALGALHVNLTGGEPLVRKEIVELVAAAAAPGLLVSMCTSGYRLAEVGLERLARAGLDLLLLSLDSVDPAVHDANRGIPGLHAQVLEAARLARGLGVGVIFNTVATAEKLRSGEIADLAALARSVGAVLNLTAPAVVGRWDGNTDVLLGPEDRERFFAALRLPGVRTDLYSGLELGSCPAGREKLSITPDGRVRLCTILPKAFGDLRTESLTAVWHRIRTERVAPGGSYCPAGDPVFVRQHPDWFDYAGEAEAVVPLERLASSS